MAERQHPDYRAIERALREQLTDDPDDTRALVQLVRLLRLQGRYSALCRFLEGRLQRDPLDWWAGVELGRALVSARRPTEAVEVLANATEIAPEQVEAWDARVHTLIELGRLDEALTVTNDALGATSRAPVDGVDAGPSTHGSKSACLRAALLNLKGIALYKKGAYLPAIRCYDSALADEPIPQRRAVYRVHRSNSLDMLGRLDQAIEGYREARREDPSSTIALLNLGISLATSGQTLKALSPLAEADVLGLRDPRLTRWLGYALFTERRHDDAIALAQRVLTERPEDAEALLVLGRGLHETGRGRKAIPVLRHALAFRPDATEASERLAVLLVDQGEILAARDVLDRGLEHNPQSVSLRYNAASLARRAGDLEGALQHGAAGLAVAPDSIPLALLLTTTCAEADDADGARKHLAAATRAAASDLSESTMPAATTALAEGTLDDVIQDLVARFEHDTLSSLRLGVASERVVVGVPGRLAIAIYHTGGNRYLTMIEAE